jgi:hypothetical protein
MALAVTVKDHWTDGNRINVTGTLTGSGNYTTNGDTLDFGLPEIKSASTPTFVDIYGKGANLYKFVPGTTIKNGKVKIVVCNTGSEFANGAYDATVTADVISFKATFHKFR